MVTYWIPWVHYNKKTNTRLKTFPHLKKFQVWILTNKQLTPFYLKGGANNLSFAEFYEMLTFFFENEDEYSGTHKLLSDLSNFFLNFIITNHAYCCQMEKPHWLNLINVYTSSFLNYQLSLNSTLDPVTCLKCLRMIMNKIRAYVGCFNLSKLHAFFHLSIYNLK